MDGAVTDPKARMRALMRRQRASLDRADRTRRSAEVAARVVALGPFGRATVVLSFQSLADEIDTAPIHEICRQRELTLLLPRVEDRSLVIATHEPGIPLRRSAQGIDEPTGPAVDPADVDLVIVPGLAFDAHGNRLGYGAGFYDRFLPTLPSSTVTVGIGFDLQLVAHVPTGPRDVPLDLVVTELQVVDARRRRRA